MAESEAREPKPKLDLLVEDHGTIIMLRVRTTAARDWVEDNVEVPAWAWVGDGFACEPRTVADVVRGAQADGLVVG